MHELYELKEKLMKELEEYAKKDVSAGSLETVDKLAHTIKNICKIIDAYEEEEEYSGDYNYDMMGGSYRRGGNSYRGSRNSYARGRAGNVRRDSMGRYFRDDDMEGMVDSIRSMMHELPQDAQKDAQRFVEKLEKQMM